MCKTFEIVHNLLINHCTEHPTVDPNSFSLPNAWRYQGYPEMALFYVVLQRNGTFAMEMGGRGYTATANFVDSSCVDEVPYPPVMTVESQLLAKNPPSE